MVADMEQLEKMDTHPRRLDAKEMISPKIGESKNKLRSTQRIKEGKTERHTSMLDRFLNSPGHRASQTAIGYDAIAAEDPSLRDTG